jgi:predicted nucleotidyltransferase component of viral defense system
MIDIKEIISYFPETLREKPQFHEYMLKEYFQYKMLDIIFNTAYGKKLSFIGGTNLRIVHNIERFSEDLDFDCFDLSREEFMDLTDLVINKISDQGINIKADDKLKDLELKAFRRNLVFPGLMYELGLSNHKEKKLLVKIESESHHFQYTPDKPIIQKFNVFTQINATPLTTLFSMKIGAVLERSKGRDFYDYLFLSGKTTPDYNYLNEKFGISSWKELKLALIANAEKVDFDVKSKDFINLMFDQNKAKKILLYPEYIKQKDCD